MKSIGDAIKQNKFSSEFQKAAINLAYTSSGIRNAMNATLRKFDLTLPQFNVLRILKGMHPGATSVKDLTVRMIDKSSNASRLVDRLLVKEWVERLSCPKDRRQVDVTITKKGIEHINKASKSLETFSDSIFSKLDNKEIENLNYLLDKLRS